MNRKADDTTNKAKDVLQTMACGVAEDVNRSDPRYDWQSIHRKVALKQLKADLLRMVGEQESEPKKPRDESAAQWNRRIARNELREELRQAIEEYFSHG